MAAMTSLYFLHSKFKLESRGTGVGYKIPTAEVLSGIDPYGLHPQLRGGLRPDSYGSRAPPTTSTARRTPPGLLREPGSVVNFNYW